jgi:O-methyltransferase
VDLGVGSDHALHGELVTHALKTVYPRLSRHGIMVFMDHHRPGITVEGNDSNPSVREACERFFKDKPERVRMLYGGPCSHAYVRKR